MFQLNGKINEFFGKQTYITVFVRSLGGGNYLEVKKHFFSKDEKFRRDKTQDFELHLENCKHHKGNRHTAYVDWDTGNPIKMGDGNQVVYSPEVLNEMQDTSDIKAAVKASIGTNYGVLMLVMCVAIGALIGFLVGQNLPAITGALTGGPTPTPPPPIGGEKMPDYCNIVHKKCYRKYCYNCPIWKRKHKW